MEIELKLLFTAEELNKFIQGEFFRSHCRGGEEGEELHLVSTYYDTPDRKLRLRGEVYRVRSTVFPDGHREYESTTKRTLRRAGGLAVREEINESQNDGTPKYGDVEILFATHVVRHIYMLQYGKGLFEMAVDRGYVETPAGLRDRIEEVEFEVKQGTAADLARLREQLLKVTVFTEETMSKYKRGCLLLGEV